MTYDPVVIANTVLNRSFEDNDLISPMKLQKIIYFLAAEYLKRTGRRLFDEPFRTWAYGPVLSSVYSEFKDFKARDITRYATSANGGSYVVDESANPEFKNILDDVWAAAKLFSAIGLSKITHRDDSAWDKAYQADRDTLSDADIACDDTYADALSLR